MIEIKFLKDLPIKLTNQNKKVLEVMGGDVYYDSEGNRYGYITFKNKLKSPIFSLQLFIREYSIEGKFIRDTEFFEPYVFYPMGEFVINQPINLDKETEAIEVTIVKATLNNRNFVNDRFLSFKEQDFVNIFQSKAPVKKRGATSSPFGSNADGSQNYDESEVKYFGSPSKSFLHYIAPILGVVVLIIVLLVVMNIVTGGVEMFNDWYLYGE